MRFLPFAVLFALAVSLTVVARAGDVLATGIAWIDHPDERLELEAARVSSNLVICLTELQENVPVQPKTNRSIRVRASARTYAVCEAGLSDPVSSQDVYIPRRGRPIPISRFGSTRYAVSCGFRLLAETQSDDGSWNENRVLTSLATLAFISNRSDDVFERNYLPALEKKSCAA